MACTPALGPSQPIMLSFLSSKLVGGDEEQAPQVAGMVRGLSLWDYRCGMTWNPCAIPRRHLKQTHAYCRHRQTEHKDLSATPKLAELVKVILWVDPEIKIVGNHGEPKRRVQNAGNTPPSHGRHASDNSPVGSWFRSCPWWRPCNRAVCDGRRSEQPVRGAQGDTGDTLSF
jgi:hypothetical protein